MTFPFEVKATIGFNDFLISRHKTKKAALTSWNKHKKVSFNMGGYYQSADCLFILNKENGKKTNMYRD